MTDFKDWHREGLANGYFEKSLSEMQPRQKLYGIVKAEQQKRGNWKKAPAGKPFQKGQDPRRPKLKKS